MEEPFDNIKSQDAWMNRHKLRKIHKFPESVATLLCTIRFHRQLPSMQVRTVPGKILLASRSNSEIKENQGKVKETSLLCADREKWSHDN